MIINSVFGFSVKRSQKLAQQAHSIEYRGMIFVYVIFLDLFRKHHIEIKILTDNKVVKTSSKFHYVLKLYTIDKTYTFG